VSDLWRTRLCLPSHQPAHAAAKSARAAAKEDPSRICTILAVAAAIIAPTQAGKIIGLILTLEQGVVANMRDVADNLKARAKKSSILRP
jgi:hypothetical protein